MTAEHKNQGLSVGEIAKLVNGELIGDASKPITGMSALEDPRPSSICYGKDLSPPTLRKTLASSNMGAIILPKTTPREDLKADFPIILADDPQRAIIMLTPKLSRAAKPISGINPKSDIHPSAKIGAGAAIGAFVSIGPDCVIGDGVVIHPNCSIYEGVSIGARTVVHAGAVIREFTEIGADCVIQPGAVLGADGFGYLPDPKLGLVAVPQVGQTSLGDRVDIGANACVDRAAIGLTRVDSGAKIDNQVQVGHNTRVGSHAILCGQVGIAGSCNIGAGAILGGAVGVADHITIAPGVRVAGRSVVAGDLAQKGDYSGYPARPAGEWRRQIATLSRLAKSGRQKS